MRNIVAQINNQLRKFGAEAIQKFSIPGRGTVVGYKPQYIIDSVNAVLGPENWRYEIVKFEVVQGEKVTVTWVLVSLWIRTPEGEWLNKGQHFGHAFVTMGAIGDALKAATTDALGKAFSTLSVGRDAYTGLLTKNGGKPLPVKETSPSPQAQAQPPQAQQHQQQQAESQVEVADDLGLPRIEGIRFVFESNTALVVATETQKGAVYNNRSLLKDLGFRWDKELKQWVMPLPQYGGEAEFIEEAPAEELPPLPESPELPAVDHDEVPF